MAYASINDLYGDQSDLTPQEIDAARKMGFSDFVLGTHSDQNRPGKKWWGPSGAGNLRNAIYTTPNSPLYNPNLQGLGNVTNQNAVDALASVNPQPSQGQTPSLQAQQQTQQAMQPAQPQTSTTAQAGFQPYQYQTHPGSDEDPTPIGWVKKAQQGLQQAGAQFNG